MIGSVSSDDSSDYIPTNVFIPDSIEDCEDDIPVEEASLHFINQSTQRKVANTFVLSLPNWSQSSKATTHEEQNNIDASTTAMRKPCQWTLNADQSIRDGRQQSTDKIHQKSFKGDKKQPKINVRVYIVQACFNCDNLTVTSRTTWKVVTIKSQMSRESLN